MSIMIQCPECRTRFRCKDKLAGKQVLCLNCNTFLTIPDSASQAGSQAFSDSDEAEFNTILLREAPWNPPQWDSGFTSPLMKVKDSSTYTSPLLPTSEISYAKPGNIVSSSSRLVFWLLSILSIIVISGLFLMFVIRLFL